MDKKIIAITLATALLIITYFYFISREVAAPTNPDETMMQHNTDYIGLTSIQAEALAQSNNVKFRVVEIDGVGQPITEDFRPGRINASTENGIVASYEVEGADVFVPEPNNNDQIIGMTTSEAEAYAAENDVMFRIGAVDGEPRPVTMDYQVGRITASIENNIVVGYSVE